MRAASVAGQRRLFAVVAAAVAVALAVVLLGVSSAAGPRDPRSVQASEAPSRTTDELTPVTATTLGSSSAPVRGTDERWHVVYELELANVRPQPAALERIDVLDAADERRVLGSFSGTALQDRVRTLAHASVNSLQLGPDVGRLVFIELAFDRRVDVPSALRHRLQVLAVPIGGGEPTPVEYTAATFALDRGVTKVGPPLAGDGWVATNGCCATYGVHRVTVLPVNGALQAAQRFAIDWMRLDDHGRFVNGDPLDVHSYISYGADILAVAGGKVVSTLDTLEDQVPGELPDPRTITVENATGNHVVVRDRDGRYALYAHMQKGSLTVAAGDRVRRGQILGKVGNTGNSSAPHLHLHIMDGPSPLGSSGLPFAIDRFTLQGQIDAQRWATATTLEGTWNEGLFPNPSARHAQLPLDLNILDFGR